jgi:hypothetical protein
MPEQQLTYTDAFCGATLTEGIDSILVLTVHRRDGGPYQEIFAHRECLARLIEDQVSLGEVFEDTV